jgi:hypothetical protein
VELIAINLDFRLLRTVSATISAMTSPNIVANEVVTDFRLDIGLDRLIGQAASKKS